MFFAPPTPSGILDIVKWKRVCARTQLPPRLLVVRLGDLLHLDRVVDHEVHELVEALQKSVSIPSSFARIWDVRNEGIRTLIFPSILMESCSYNQTLTVEFCFRC